MTKKLSELKKGERGVISSVCLAEGKAKDRLRAMGFSEGTRVEMSVRSPLGDPTAYLIKGSVIALRESEASEICVDVEE